VAVGKGVKQLRPGTRVEYVLLEETGVVPAPQGLSYEEAATLPTAGLTAYLATVGQASIGSTRSSTGCFRSISMRQRCSTFAPAIRSDAWC
jgi:NADPH:quinone reductase-like Zn-dependent oxidoreductase